MFSAARLWILHARQQRVDSQGCEGEKGEKGLKPKALTPAAGRHGLLRSRRSRARRRGGPDLQVRVEIPRVARLKLRVRRLITGKGCRQEVRHAEEVRPVKA